jgi:hypothetical protein
MMSMKNLEIQFTTEIIKKVKSLHFQADQIGSVLFVLFGLYENRTDLLDEFDDYNKQKRAIILYKEMEMKKLVTRSEDDSDEDAPIYILSKEGTELVEFIKTQFTKNHEVITSETIAISGVDQIKETIKDNENVEEWIKEWVDIFPRGIRSGGRLLRGDTPSCLRKMRVFLREYPYSKDIILEATRKYLQAKEAENFAYTRCAVYFIFRVEAGSGKISDLATWCEQVEHDQKSGNQNTINNSEIMV